MPITVVSREFLLSDLLITAGTVVITGAKTFRALALLVPVIAAEIPAAAFLAFALVTRLIAGFFRIHQAADRAPLVAIGRCQ